MLTLSRIERLLLKWRSPREQHKVHISINRLINHQKKSSQVRMSKEV